jgi:protein SCO1/2
MERAYGYVDTRYISALLLFIVVLIGGSFYSYNHRYDRLPQLLEVGGTVLATPKSLTNFNLIDDQGLPFSLQDLKGHWTFMVFGFTSCHIMCPKTLLELSEVYEKLHTTDAELPKFVMISVDPQHDTPEELHHYVKNFHPEFTAATGEPQQIRELAKELSVFYLKIKNEQGDIAATEYTIDHGGTVMLINPQGQLRAVFPLPHDSEIITKDYHAIVSAGITADHFGFLVRHSKTS